MFFCFGPYSDIVKVRSLQVQVDLLKARNKLFLHLMWKINPDIDNESYRGSSTRLQRLGLQQFNFKAKMLTGFGWPLRFLEVLEEEQNVKCRFLILYFAQMVSLDWIIWNSLLICLWRETFKLPCKLLFWTSSQDGRPAVIKLMCTGQHLVSFGWILLGKGVVIIFWSDYLCYCLLQQLCTLNLILWRSAKW